MDGWLNINKPVNMTSAVAVAIVKRRLKAKKVGHGGTLDPLAVGVLPICIGKATKETEKIMNFQKEYLFNIKFGETRTTDDRGGEIVEKNSIIPSESEILNTMPKFMGEIEQTPPIYSAIKVNGKRAYQLARQGKKIELKARKVVIYDLIFKGFVAEKEAQFLVKCSKGFYVRKFGFDFAKKMGALGYISYLERRAVGIFNQSNIVELDDIKENMELIKLIDFL
ncbi:MAG: hypothetical protein Ta2D_05990 [Rickettsiales bacterium]|nr:MAG: hypothetical protein Ta2D_05990 [Rickettsiales bacterium]